MCHDLCSVTKHDSQPKVRLEMRELHQAMPEVRGRGNGMGQQTRNKENV